MAKLHSTVTGPQPPWRKSTAAFKSAARAAAEVRAYEKEIARLAKNAKDDPDAILEALGCSKIDLHHGEGWRLVRTKQPSSLHEPLIRSRLCEILAEQVTKTIPSDLTCVSLLDGLLQNDRWKEVVKTTTGAYDFAHLLSQITASICFRWRKSDARETPENKSSLPRAIRLHAYPVVTQVINAWIAPRRLPGPLSSGLLLRELFGAPWYDIVLDFDENDFRAWDIRDTVSAANPAFLPGLVLDQAESFATPLPALEAA